MVLAAGGVAASFVTGMLSWIQSRQNRTHIKEVDLKLDKTNHELNSRLTELVEAVRIAARSAGILEGIEQQKRRVAAGDQGDPDHQKSTK